MNSWVFFLKCEIEKLKSAKNIKRDFLSKNFFYIAIFYQTLRLFKFLKFLTLSFNEKIVDKIIDFLSVLLIF